MRPKRPKPITDGPTDISILLERILGHAVIQDQMQGLSVVALWPDIVGSTVASEATLQDFRDGVLWVRCPSSAWRSELNFAKKAILERANALLGKPLAKDLRFL